LHSSAEVLFQGERGGPEGELADPGSLGKPDVKQSSTVAFNKIKYLQNNFGILVTYYFVFFSVQIELSLEVLASK